MIKFKIGGKDYLIPSEYKDSILTYRMYTSIYDGGNTEMIAAITGINVQIVRNAKIGNLATLLSTIAFINEQPVWESTEKIGNYKIPKSPVLETLGQFEDLRALLKRFTTISQDDVKKLNEETFDIYLEACAIYAQKVRDGEYDHDKAIEMKEELKDCQVNEILGNGAFFLMLPLNLSTSTKTGSPKTPSPQKKKKRASVASRKSSGRSRR